MLRTATLGQRIAAGFGLMLAIMAALGGMAMLNMRRVQGQAHTLASEHVKAWSVANDVERASLRTVYAMRGYSYTHSAAFWDETQKWLAQVEASLADANKLGQSGPNLAKLKENAALATAKLQRYGELVAQTRKLAEQVAEAEKRMDADGKAWDKAVTTYRRNQAAKQRTELAAGQAGEAGLERAWKLATINEVADLGGAVQNAYWTGTAKRDLSLVEKAMPNFEAMAARITELRGRTAQKANLAELDECQQAIDGYQKALATVLTAAKAIDGLNSERRQVADEVVAAAEETAKVSQADADRIAVGASTSLSRATGLTAIGLAVALLVGAALAVSLTRGITGPLFRVIDGLGRGSEQVSSASGQVSASSQQLAEGASHQASSLEETSAALEEMASMTQQNADHAKQANAMASEAHDAAEQGNLAMGQMSEAIGRIKNSSDETAKILKTIDEIAFQTNLLALNAAVEAARAGEAGKGFAVVAEEVRNLAQRSAEAAKSTATLIEQSQQEANQGVTASVQVGEILGRIVTAVKNVAGLLAEVAAGSGEQAQGIQQINQAVNEMDRVTQSNAASAEEAAAASEELSAQAREMGDMVQVLIDLVGSAAGSRQVAATPPPAARAHRPAPVRQPVRAATNGHATAAREAEVVIPLAGGLDDF